MIVRKTTATQQMLKIQDIKLSVYDEILKYHELDQKREGGKNENRGYIRVVKLQ